MPDDASSWSLNFPLAPDAIADWLGDSVSDLEDHRYVRQRCAWSEEALLDVDLERVYVPAGREHGVGRFGADAWIEVTAGSKPDC